MENCWSKRVMVMGNCLNMMVMVRKMKMVHYWDKVVMVKGNWLSKTVMEDC